MQPFSLFRTAGDLLHCFAPDGGKFTPGKSEWQCLKQRKNKNFLWVTASGAIWLAALFSWWSCETSHPSALDFWQGLSLSAQQRATAAGKGAAIMVRPAPSCLCRVATVCHRYSRQRVLVRLTSKGPHPLSRMQLFLRTCLIKKWDTKNYLLGTFVWWFVAIDPMLSVVQMHSHRHAHLSDQQVCVYPRKCITKSLYLILLHIKVWKPPIWRSQSRLKGWTGSISSHAILLLDPWMEGCLFWKAS